VLGQWDTSGNLILGQVATNSGNAYWNNSTKQLQFRGGSGGTQVQAYVDTTGAVVAGGGTVTLDSNGLALAGGIGTSNSIRWLNSSPLYAVGQIYGNRISSSGGIATFQLSCFSNSADTTGQATTLMQTINDAGHSVQFFTAMVGSAANDLGYFNFVGSGGTFSGVLIGASGVPNTLLDVRGVGGFERDSIGTTSTDGILLTNTTAAANNAQQYSPRLHFKGQGWKTNATAASQTVDFIEELRPVQGATSPTGNLVWAAQVNAGGYTDLMTLTSAGNLGIGTNSPAAQLELKQAIPVLRLSSTTTTDLSAFNFYDSAGIIGAFQCIDSAYATTSRRSAFEIVNLTTTGVLSFWTNSTQRVTVSASGGVQFNAYGAGTLTTDASGNITASSDERLKTEAGAFTRGLDALRGLRPRLYRWNEKSGMETEGVYAGLFAGEVERAIPEAVGVGLGGYRTLSDRTLIATLINAVNELEREVNDLRTRLGEN
jgi:hypothetical protein